jgi:hypothetical protein
VGEADSPNVSTILTGPSQSGFTKFFLAWKNGEKLYKYFARDRLTTSGGVE